MDDAELTASVLGELDTLLGVRHPPLHASVTRWEDALPQYEVGHLLRVGRIDQDVAGLDAVGIAGAALRGVGIPACIGSGRVAAQRVLASLGHGSGPASS
jgi:oxygen-dependent protoporphyrinogen oxidase